MMATAAALAALAGFALLELRDPAPVREALAALGVAFANSIPVGSLGGFIAMLDTQLNLGVTVASFAVTGGAVAGAGALCGRWTRWRVRDPLGAVTALLCGMALLAGFVLGCAALRIVHPGVLSAAILVVLVAGSRMAAGGSWLRAVLRPAPGWSRPVAVAVAATVTIAALAPATGDPALSRTMPAAAGLAWGGTGAVEAVMGASYGLDRALVAALDRMLAAVGLFQGGDPAIRVLVADAAARLWSPAGWLLAAVALAAAFRPRDAAGRWAAVAIVATSPALAGLALADQPRLFMLAPAVACAGWIGRGRIVRGAVMAVLAGWFGAGGEPGHVAKSDLMRLALTGVAVGALVAAAAPGRLLRGAASVVLLLSALRTATLAAATGSWLAGAGLESHPGFAARVLGPHAELMERLNATAGRRERILLIGGTRRWPSTCMIGTPRTFHASPREIARAADSPDAVRRRIRQLGVRWVIHWPAEERLSPEPGPGWTDDMLRHWTAWWTDCARLEVASDRLEPVRGGYWLYRLAESRVDRTILPPTLPGVEPVAAAPVGLQRIAGRIPQISVSLALSASPPVELILIAADRNGYRDVGMWEALVAGAVARRDAPGALRWQERIAGFAPAYGGAALRRLHLELARRARAARDPHAAERHLRMALDLDSGDAAAWAELAEILLWLGRKADAQDAMANACRLNPGHPGYRGTLGHMRRAS